MTVYNDRDPDDADPNAPTDPTEGDPEEADRPVRDGDPDPVLGQPLTDPVTGRYGAGPLEPSFDSPDAPADASAADTSAAVDTTVTNVGDPPVAEDVGARRWSVVAAVAIFVFAAGIVWYLLS